MLVAAVGIVEVVTDCAESKGGGCALLVGVIGILGVVTGCAESEEGEGCKLVGILGVVIECVESKGG